MSNNEFAPTNNARHPGSTNTFRAAHLDVPIDAQNPPPPSTSSLKFLLLQVKMAWDDLEFAGHDLLALDTKIYANMTIFVRAKRPTHQTWYAHKTALISQTFQPVVDLAEIRSHDMATAIGKLKDAVEKEPETLEARAAVAIDIPILENCVKTVGDIIGVTKTELTRARRDLGDGA